MGTAVVRLAEVAPEPWADGGGTTRELLRADDGSWRVSLAEVGADGPFSHLPGRHRLLTVVDGPVLRLVVDGVETVVEPRRPFAFDGAAAVTASVPEGPVRVLNVIADPAVQAFVTVLELGRGSTLPLADDRVALVLKGRATVGDIEAAAYDLVVGPAEVSGRCTLAVVTLEQGSPVASCAVRTLTYHVAATLDGFIAGPDGQFDFFPFGGDLAQTILAELPETMPAHARGPLGVADAPNQRFDTVVMGRSTYEPGLALGVASPYSHLRQVVFSSTLVDPHPDVEVVSGDAVAVVRALKQEDGAGIWLCGGGRLAAQLLPEIDELVVKRNPIVIGSGIPLFGGPFAPTSFEPVSTRTFDGGVAMEAYRRVSAPA